ncbi:MAG: 2-oxo-4-hydroxy-4-carboxy-5-ureidoimidazoline decarboxylase [Rhodococcus sp.]|uniref:2-oxo-4-hydroxy-4-carboxy-5-ureidoimidazoline decarboxylase n=1 Tax=Rhodococcoides fascians TaxID=1828 RepID=UPI001A1E0912|nr:2-oxo-4-hydroxy-4-carboxy-5-ureidoimidazoline decarboxylase [Rhodococcus fascians]MBJ7350779.1 2-oxo-4-hydroxy-4-carboxy-5-ureidoimidazoline decarboxylase [Rhodococcus sp. (in: high G+C Gram-positive bacteria)]MBY4206202.1 2-oxo-4-hydroxy-4-carboxy-5-ureidoimidazoline decarboxylase [Rhodococcus fascians]MDJ0426868.1 2-oxo-4-hydroxy-4-carboxy-5-ureidoimidazoline decarboxylase [Rhodococcus fascians]
MLMHQGLGLETFNDLPRRKAVHALYECCCSVAWASRLADGRPYRSRDELFTAAAAELNELSDNVIDALAATLPEPNKMCTAMDAESRSALGTAARAYESKFGWRYVSNLMMTPDGFEPRDVLMELGHRLDNDEPTERLVMRRELVEIDHRRLGRLLGPEGGWPPY